MRRLSRAAPPVKAAAVLTCRRLKRSERVLLWKGREWWWLSAVLLLLLLLPDNDHDDALFLGCMQSGGLGTLEIGLRTTLVYY